MIARDTFSTISQSAAGATSLSFSYTSSGTYRYVQIFTGDEHGDTTTGVTYGGVAMTQLAKVSRNPNTGSLHIYAWGLAAPSTGAQTVTITRSGTIGKLSGAGISYTGAQQITAADATITANGSGVAATSVSATITTVAATTAITAFSVMDNGGITAGSGLTLLNTVGSYGLFEASTFPKITAGTYSGTSNGTLSNVGIIMISITIAPPEITTQAVTSIDYYTATGNATVVNDGGLIISERGFVWNTSTNPTTSNSKVIVAGTTGVYSGALTGLSQSTHYYVRPYVITDNGTTYGTQVEFDTLTPPANQISKDISGVQGATYDVSVNVTGTLGSVTVSLGSTGVSQVINAGSGITTFSGIYGGVSGLIIIYSATFNGTIDDVMYVRRVDVGTIDWSLSTFTIEFAIASSVFFRRIEDKDFNKSRIYRYLDLMFKDLDAYVTVTIRQEKSDLSSEKTKIFLVGNSVGTITSPFIKKRVSFLSKNQAIIIGLSNSNKDDAFSIAQFILKGMEQSKKLFSPSKIISIT